MKRVSSSVGAQFELDGALRDPREPLDQSAETIRTVASLVPCSAVGLVYYRVVPRLELFMVRRPGGAFDGTWGAPTTDMMAGDRFEDTARRLGRRYLHLEVDDPGRYRQVGVYSVNGAQSFRVPDVRAHLLLVVLACRLKEDEASLVDINQQADGLPSPQTVFADSDWFGHFDLMDMRGETTPLLSAMLAHFVTQVPSVDLD